MGAACHCCETREEDLGMGAGGSLKGEDLAYVENISIMSKESIPIVSKDDKNLQDLLQGRWFSFPDGAPIGTLVKDEVCWDFPSEEHQGTKISFHASKIFMEMDGVIYSGAIKFGKFATIRWTDGEVWTQDPNIELHRTCCCWKWLCKAPQDGETRAQVLDESTR
eukprot:TRINITY_DN63922_c0_g1_i1.p2 TRINITY_DN63922_c0_g1~~TRINITY_DN63922_c0_g1_i1.p2  ORF type:complete len:165 (-),score=23.45 TRINITY_DN63922_c0_g1_i1:25-519(-)